MKQTRHAHAKPAWMANIQVPVLILVLSCLVLFAACFVLQTEKQVALFSTLAILVIGFTPQFRRRLKSQGGILFFLVTAYVVYGGISTLYAYAPKLALSEYSRVLAAYAVFLAAFTFTSPAAMPRTVSILTGSITVLSFLHLDAASWGIIGNPVMQLFQKLTGGYLPDSFGYNSYGYNGYTERLYGLFGNANTMACMCAIGLFLSIYLLMRANGRKRIWPCVALLINSVTFLLCISLGATVALGFTVLVVAILLRGAKNRLTFLLITLETLLVSGIVTILSISHLGAPASAGFLVWVFCIAGIAALFGLDHVLRPRLVEILCRRIKTLCIGAAALVVILVGGGLLLFSQTVPVTLNGTETLHKRFFPGTGTCEITLDVDGPARLQILSASQPEILQETATQILNVQYEGTVTVEIPEDTIEVQMNILPMDDGTVTVNSISYRGTEKSGEIAPGYRGVPKDILQRLQGLSTNHSAMQRMVFMQDGLELWKQSPVFGRGLGGFENGVLSVQNFFYETKYAHNHYVQLLADLGLIGLALFVGLLVFAIKSLWPLRRQEEAAGLTPALLGAVLMFAVHGAIEFSPAVAEVSVFAFGALGLVATLAPPLPVPQKRVNTVAWATTLGGAVLFGIYTILLMLNAQASTAVSSGNVTLNQIAKYSKTDVFEGNDYRLSYIVNGITTGDAAVMEQAMEFADDLSKVHSNSIGPYLTEFYLQQGLVDKAAAVSAQYLADTRSISEHWNSQLQLFHTYLIVNLENADMRDALVQLSLDTYQQLVEVNTEQIDDLPLDAANAAYITQLLSTEGDLETRLNTLYFDSAIAPDTNQDGCPDALTVRKGQLQNDAGVYTAAADTLLQLDLLPTQSGVYTMEFASENGAGIRVSISDYEIEYLFSETGVTVQWSVPEEALNQSLSILVGLPQGTTVQHMTTTLTDSNT